MRIKYCPKHGMFFLLLLVSINFTSCLAGQSEIYGTYEFSKMEDVDEHLSNLMEKYKENEKRRKKAREENSYGITLVELPGASFDAIYDAISIDSDSLIFNTIYLYTISAEELYYENKELKLKCPDNLFVKYEPIIEGYLCNRTIRLGINSFEPVKNLDKQTEGSYPNGYKISYETKGGTPDFLLVFKHIKDKGKVLITINKNKFIAEHSHKGTGKSAKNYISEITEGYKKPIIEYKKVLEKELVELAKRKEEEKLERERIDLITVVEKGNYKEVNLLLKDGKNVNTADASGKTLLIIAASKNDYEMAKILIKNGADVNLAYKNGNVPLHFAVANGNLDLVKLLVETGAKKNVKNNKGQTPLDIVIDDEIKQYLK